MRERDFARAFIVSVHSLPFPLHCRGYLTPWNTVISSNRFHIWILFSLGALGKQEHALKWAFMPQSAWGQGSALKPLRPSHGCWFHPRTERASQQDTASLLFSSHSLIASLWQVKCQEPGRGGVWRRRDKRFSPSINLKTYSADNLNGTGISFSMVTRDGRRLGKKKESTDPGKSDAEDAGKLANFAISLCWANCTQKREKLFPCLHGLRQAVPWP